jgi:hemoglobin
MYLLYGTDMKPESQNTIPSGNRHAAHPSITAQQVSELVDGFYARVRNDIRLEPIFAAQMSRHWDEHLPRMNAFWRAVLLKTGEYKGKPVPAHTRLHGVGTAEFGIWLDLFSETAGEVFSPEAQPIVVEAAKRIATSLWLAMTADPFTNPPDWSAPGGPNGNFSTRGDAA